MALDGREGRELGGSEAGVGLLSQAARHPRDREAQRGGDVTR